MKAAGHFFTEATLHGQVSLNNFRKVRLALCNKFVSVHHHIVVMVLNLNPAVDKGSDNPVCSHHNASIRQHVSLIP
jgi:hypothetical protein